jgi:hypothetical protein
MKALYPFVGGTAAKHKFNFMDARDLDAAFRLVFSGGVTHSTNGVQFGGVNGWVLAHAFVASSVLRFFNRDLKEYLESNDPYADIFAGTRHQFEELGMLDRELLVSFKIQLAGMLLSSKGDRISMHSSLETRYPFLDNDLACSRGTTKSAIIG